MSTSSDIPYFQDYFPETGACTNNSEPEPEPNPDEAFVELANASVVGFRISGSKRKKEVRVRQDSACQTHTGGIVWETAYLLAGYLKCKSNGVKSLGKVLEVGSGCGMLGIILAASRMAKQVVMTETTEVIPNLEENLALNMKSKKEEDQDHNYTYACCTPDKISVRQLRWDEFEKDILECQADKSSDLDPHSFDTIIGTDVIFSTSLVKPLLKTLREMSHAGTHIYLCVQIRCADSHALLLKKASKYGLAVEDCTDDLNEIPELKWGLAMDCIILHLSVTKEERVDNKRKRETKTGKKSKKSSKK